MEQIEPFDWDAFSQKPYTGNTITELFKYPCKDEEEFYKKKSEVALFVKWLCGNQLEGEHMTKLNYYDTAKSWDINGVQTTLMMASYRIQYSFQWCILGLDIYDLWLYCTDFEGTPAEYAKSIENMGTAAMRDRFNRRGFVNLEYDLHSILCCLQFD